MKHQSKVPQVCSDIYVKDCNPLWLCYYLKQNTETWLMLTVSCIFKRLYSLFQSNFWHRYRSIFRICCCKQLHCRILFDVGKMSFVQFPRKLFRMRHMRTQGSTKRRSTNLTIAMKLVWSLFSFSRLMQTSQQFINELFSSYSWFQIRTHCSHGIKNPTTTPLNLACTFIMPIFECQVASKCQAQHQASCLLNGCFIGIHFAAYPWNLSGLMLLHVLKVDNIVMMSWMYDQLMG